MAIGPKLWLHEQEREMDRGSDGLGVVGRLHDHETFEGLCFDYG